MTFTKERNINDLTSQLCYDAKCTESGQSAEKQSNSSQGLCVGNILKAVLKLTVDWYESIKELDSSSLPLTLVHHGLNITGQEGRKESTSSMKVISTVSDGATEATVCYLYPFRHFSFADIK